MVGVRAFKGGTQIRTITGVQGISLTRRKDECLHIPDNNLVMIRILRGGEDIRMLFVNIS
jgi:hypothetical protein